MAGPTQFKSTDTRRWWLGYGSGVDGDLTIASNTTEAPIDSACTGTATQTSLSATNASFASGQAVLIHQTQGTGAGQWELGYITGYTAGTITLKDALYYSYTTGAQVRVLKQYKNVTINTGVTYTTKAWNGTVGGILACLANGTVTGVFSAIGKGFRGAQQRTGGNRLSGYHAESLTGNYNANPTAAYQASATYGGGGAWNNSADAGSCGGGGAYAVAGVAGGLGHNSNGSGPGAGGATYGTASLTSLFFGTGGGSGSTAYNSTVSGYGGNGGGIILIIARNVGDLGATKVNGNAGMATMVIPDQGYGYSGAGGGGAAGSILIKTQICNPGNAITASGGLGGNGGDVGYGGNGGAGRIHLDYVVSYSGTTTPTLDATQDLTLRQPIKRRLTI